MSYDKQIEVAIDKLFSKIGTLDIPGLSISEYNQNYFKKYIDNYLFYMSLYSQLFKKALKKLNKPICESSFVDYGGGCGMLSCLAKEIGFKHVIYNDIYDQSVSDARKISKKLELKIDHFICGDIENFVSELDHYNIKPDLICSFDVLEHIYSLEKWFKHIALIDNRFSLLFMTSANPVNPFISARLKKMQTISECEGVNKTYGWKEIDANTSYKEERSRIIQKRFPLLNETEVNHLVGKTRGLRIEDIENLVQKFIDGKRIDYQIKHPTNTCDPYTGNWVEHLINLKELKQLIEKNDLRVEITNSSYGFNDNKKLNIVKYFLNQLIKVSKPSFLFFSPTYTIEVEKLSAI